MTCLYALYWFLYQSPLLSLFTMIWYQYFSASTHYDLIGAVFLSALLDTRKNILAVSTHSDLIGAVFLSALLDTRKNILTASTHYDLIGAVFLSALLDTRKNILALLRLHCSPSLCLLFSIRDCPLLFHRSLNTSPELHAFSQFIVMFCECCLQKRLLLITKAEKL